MIASHEKTKEAILNLKVGDAFTEMYSVFYIVVYVGYLGIIILHDSSHVNRYLHFNTIQDLDKKLAYNSIPGYWMDYVNYRADVVSLSEKEAKIIIKNIKATELKIKKNLSRTCGREKNEKN